MNTKEAKTKFGGERLDATSELFKNNIIEHLARYKQVKGDKRFVALDMGCGTGYGSYHLAKIFKKVYGVDVSDEAIQEAKKHWKKNNVQFQVGSGTKIPFRDNFFDVVATFEVFEHIKEWKQFLKELKRVTKKNGIIYISTPNKDIHSPGTKKPLNPYHFFEMTVDEFKKALQPYFIINKFYGQRTPVYNDHWIWKIVDPILFTFKAIIPFKITKSITLKVINWIKPNLEESDVVFTEDPVLIKKSRQMLAVCLNNKK